MFLDTQRLFLFIGSSTGGPSALSDLISHFPVTFNLPIIIVQHINADFFEGLCRTLQLHSNLPVKIAGLGQKIEKGTIYLAGHLNKKLSITPEKKINYINIQDQIYTPLWMRFFLRPPELMAINVLP